MNAECTPSLWSWVISGDGDQIVIDYRGGQLQVWCVDTIMTIMTHVPLSCTLNIVCVCVCMGGCVCV